MPSARDVLTPDALAMLQTVASTGSFAGAASAPHPVAHSFRYYVRQT